MSIRKPYPTDLAEEQWDHVYGMFPHRPAGLVGRPREYPLREIVNAILYLVRTGCQWRNLPHDFPPYTTVSYYFHLWRKNGLLERLHDQLRHDVRRQEGREAEPSVVIIDSQSVKTTEKGGRPNLRKLSVMTSVNRSKAANAISP